MVPSAGFCSARSSTANGSIALTATASARCSVSLGPEDWTKANWTALPQVWATWVHTAFSSSAESCSVPCCPVAWFSSTPGAVFLSSAAPFTRTTTLIWVAVTPGAVEPPLLEPAGQGLTHGIE